MFLTARGGRGNRGSRHLGPRGRKGSTPPPSTQPVYLWTISSRRPSPTENGSTRPSTGVERRPRPGGRGRRLRTLSDQRPLDLGGGGVGVRERLGLGLGDVSLRALAVGRAQHAVALEPGSGLGSRLGAVANRRRQGGLASTGTPHGDDRSARCCLFWIAVETRSFLRPDSVATLDPGINPSAGGPLGAARAPAAQRPGRAPAPGTAADHDRSLAPGHATAGSARRTPEPASRSLKSRPIPLGTGRGAIVWRC